ncbi:MAG: hypothetical protein U9N14_03360 [Pseudomonadota bacterium]|nr:hypothetical protein [Pseudomonadota bacterium]
MVPIGDLPPDFYVHDDARQALVGRRWGRVYRLSAPVRVRPVEAVPLAGSLIFEILDRDGADLPAFLTGKRDSRHPQAPRQRKKKRR